MGFTRAGLGLDVTDAGKKHKHKKKKHKKKGHEPGCLEEECVDPGNVCNPSGSKCCLCFNCIRLNELSPYTCSPIDPEE